MTSIKEAGYYDFAASRRIDRERQVDKISAEKTNESSRISTETNSVGDTLNLSATGELLLLKKTDLDQYFQEIERIETTDAQTLSQIRQKINDGVYRKTEVIDQIVSGLVTSPTESLMASDKVEQAAGQSENSPELETIRDRMRSGYYDSEEVYNDIASKMLNPDYLISE